MPSIIKSATVPYSAEKMYDLVNAVEDYTTFLPWCQGSEILSRNAHEVKATLYLSMGGLQQSFTTLNRLQPRKRIEMCLVEGPFKHLEGFWLFEPLENNHCKIKLELEFELANRLFAMAIGPMFQQIATRLVDAFCQRAKVVYAEDNV